MSKADQAQRSRNRQSFEGIISCSHYPSGNWYPGMTVGDFQINQIRTGGAQVDLKDSFLSKLGYWIILT